MMSEIKRITKVVRKADKQFEIAGGTSRHWVRDHFLVELNAEGLCIKDKAEIKALEEKLINVSRLVVKEYYHYNNQFNDVCPFSVAETLKELKGILDS